MSPQAATLPQTLQREWTAWAFGSTALTLTAGVLYSLRAGVADAVRWAAPALLVSAYTLFFARRRLAANHPTSSATLFPTLGPGNRLTLVRGLLIAFLAGFVLLPRQAGGLAWAAMILYTLSDVCDYFDGLLARRARHQTLLGEELDIEFDALGLLFAVSVAIRLGALPVWYLIIGLSRYAFLFGIWILRRRGRTLSALPPSGSRRPIAGLTMGFTSAVLWPILPPAVTHIAALVFAFPISFSFIRDWLVVSGTVDPQSSTYLRLRAAAKRWLLGWLPLPLRAVALLSGVMLVAGQLRAPAVLALGVSIAVEIVGVVSIALGFAGRVGAFVLLVPLALALASQDPTPLTAVLLVTSLLVLILGSGDFSIAKPEERILSQRAGERP